MKIIVIGASGYLGSDIYRQIPSGFHRIGTARTSTAELIGFNLANPDDFNYELIEAGDFVVLTAAISNPDLCSSEFMASWALNVDATCKFINLAIKRGAKIIFCSSDAIFGERGEAVDEHSKPSPLGEYAEMKYAVESYFKGNFSFKAIRLSYIFSSEDKFTHYLKTCFANDLDAEIFNPFNRAVIFRQDVVDGIFNLIKKWQDFSDQAINFGGPSIVSRVEFAELIKKFAMPALKIRVVEPPCNFFASRPKVIAMHSPVLVDLLGRPPLTLGESIQKEFN